MSTNPESEEILVILRQVEAMGRHLHAKDGMIARTPGLKPEQAFNRIDALKYGEVKAAVASVLEEVDETILQYPAEVRANTVAKVAKLRKRYGIDEKGEEWINVKISSNQKDMLLGMNGQKRNQLNIIR